jgi:hypothetical protein
LKKLLLILACAAAAIPAVALASADHDVIVGGGTPTAAERSFDARYRAKPAQRTIKHRAERAEKARQKARARKQARRHASASQAGASNGGATTPPQLQAIAACESGGNPHAIGGGGAFRGKYQFDRGTWASVGGSGDPAAAPEAEQDRRAAMLLARSGASPWPVCGS